MTLSQGYVLLNRYRIVSNIKQGGMGSVYRAWDLNLKTPCAVKENLETSAEAQRQFMQEAMMMAQLAHPSLPRVIDQFVLPNMGQYLVMEFVEGQDLQEVLEQRGRLTDVEVIPYIQQICDALTYLHNQPHPIIHRDIKPANIKITPDGRAVLVDFGIAKVFESHRLTTQGARAVTPGFSPPEQYGHGATNHQTDIYALGATLYALLTGQDPPESVYRLASNATLPHPVGVPTHITSAMLRAMALDPNNRFASAADFKAALTTPLPPPRTPLPRWLVPTVGGVVAVIAAAIIISFLLQPSAPTPTPGTTVQIVVVTNSADSVEAESAIADDTEANDSLVIRDNTAEDPASPTPRPATKTPIPSTATPDIAYPLLSTVGSSANGTDIQVYQYGSGPQAVLLVGGLHSGFAPAGVDLAERAISYFTDTPVPDGVTLYIIPNANPDSRYDPGELGGRLNGNGVDLNRNFGCNWSTEATWRNQEVNPGTSAFSEPETQALRNFVNQIDPVAAIFYEAKATNGMVAPGNCNGQTSSSGELADVYLRQVNYELYTGFSLTGDGSDWLVSQGVATISILLRDYEVLSSSEWIDNRDAIEATLSYYD
ncbi:MAG: protein kinase [Chloroflexi bacterium]|nr:protein kinase [Chloroflexota bacterium]MBP8059207.1 protein kinase [Chloroflexota bacterium]